MSRPNKPDRAHRLVEGSLQLSGYLNARLFELLEAVDALGSINRAARSVGLSYKGAWDMIDRANGLSPELLVDAAFSGSRKGGTRLTDAGRKLIGMFRYVRQQHEIFLDRINLELTNDPDASAWLKRLLMRASARNQWLGTVADIRLGPVMAEVSIRLKRDTRLIGSVESRSVDTLGLALGREVMALVQASMIVLVTDFEGYRLSARNQLTGTVIRIHEGAVDVDVVIELPGGDLISASISAQSFDDLALTPGNRVTAVFKSNAVIMAGLRSYADVSPPDD